MTVRSVLIVGYPGDVHVGAHFHDAARELGLTVTFCDCRRAYDGNPLVRRLLWWGAGRRPAQFDAFSEHVWTSVRTTKPDIVLATGIAPISDRTLRRIGALGIPRLNFLTDDPWNPAHRAPWFLQALTEYDWVFSPRPGNLDDLRTLGVRHVELLPFAYNPRVHYYVPAGSTDASEHIDVVVAGGADRDRVKLVAPLIEAGLSVALFGGYWERYAETRSHARGFLDAQALRATTGAASVSLGLVRRANRDDHSMRTFEIPAMRGCLLAEYTPGHQALFGAEGETAMFFTNAGDLVDRARWLVERPSERVRLALAAHARIVHGHHTYRDRLQTMIEAIAA